MAIVVEKIEKIIKIGPETAEIEHFHSNFQGDRRGNFSGRRGPINSLRTHNLLTGESPRLNLVVLTIFENLPVGRSGPYFMVL